MERRIAEFQAAHTSVPIIDPVARVRPLHDRATMLGALGGGGITILVLLAKMQPPRQIPGCSRSRPLHGLNRHSSERHSREPYGSKSQMLHLDVIYPGNGWHSILRLDGRPAGRPPISKFIQDITGVSNKTSRGCYGAAGSARRDGEEVSAGAFAAPSGASRG